MLELPPNIQLKQKVLCERGAAARLADECAVFGRRGLAVYGPSLVKNGHRDRILAGFGPSMTVACFERATHDEPDLHEVEALVKVARDTGAAWIAGVGGGSVLDLAKAAAGLYHTSPPYAFYQEGGVIGTKGIPFIAVPTTAGTGTEATFNAVIINKEKKMKLSIRDASFLARTAVLDAELLVGLPKDAFANAAMDAFVQAYESFISKNATAESEGLALKAIELIHAHVVSAYRSGAVDDLEQLLQGSHLSGVAFNLSRLGVIHGLAHPLGALYHQPHGLICALLFGPSIELNREAMGGKYELMSKAMGCDLSHRIRELIDTFAIVSPFKGMEIRDRESIIAQTLASGSTAANPRPVTREDVLSLLQQLF